MHSAIHSPLTGKSNVRVLREFSREQLCREWLAAFGIDIRPELEGAERILQCRCLESSLVFYEPNCVTGTSRLYAQLCRFDWYYQQKKWEHDVALRFCRGRRNLLEIGCGSGNFLRRAVHEDPGLRAVGLEINEAIGLPQSEESFELIHEKFETFAEAHEGEFDVVCAFQVLEHVADPLAFLDLCCRAAKPGGLVLFGTPDADSFIKDSHNLLDLPPHHMSGWNKRAYEFLPGILPLRLREVLPEPLAPYHVDYYLQTCLSRFAATSDPRRFFFLGHPRRMLRWLLLAGLRRLVRGQSILAVYEKI